MHAMRSRIGLIAFVVGLTVATACARGGAETTFNGWWHLDETASTGVPPMMKGHQTVVHLTQNGDRFTIEFLFDGQSMNTSDFVLDGQTHPGQLGATQEAKWTDRPRTLAIDIHRPEGGPMPAGNEHLVWTLQADGQEIQRTSSHPGTSAAPQVYIYKRIPPPAGTAGQ